MTSLFTLKLELENGQMRRINLPIQCKISYGELIYNIKSALSYPSACSLSLKYIDSEGDLVTLASDIELHIALMEAAKINRIPKFILHQFSTKPEDFARFDDDQINMNDQEKMVSGNGTNMQGHFNPDLVVSWFLREVIQANTRSQEGFNPKWRPNGPRGCRGSGKKKSQNFM